MTTKEAAWLGRRDLEAIARMSDYDLSTVLKPKPNVSRRRLDLVTAVSEAMMIACGVIVALVLVSLFLL